MPRYAIFGAILLALLPMAALLILAYLIIAAEFNRDLQTTVAAAVANADHLFEKVVGELDKLAELSDAPCNDRTIQALQQAVYRAPEIREIGLVRAGSLLYCTNFGPAEIGLSSHIVGPPYEPLYFAVDTTAIMQQRSLLIYSLDSTGEGVNAVVDPAELVGMVARLPFSEQIGIDLRLSNGSRMGAVGGLGPPQWGAQTVTVELASSRYPVLATTSAPLALLWKRFGESLPFVLLTGISLVIISLAFYWRALKQRASLPAQLQVALRRREFEVCYQPVVDLQNNRCVGVEALLRWRHSKHGLMQPDVFIAVAEASGVIIPITKWLLLKVRNDLMPYFHDRRDFHIGINLVAEHFQDATIVKDIEKALAGSGFAPSALLLEATERQLIDDNAEHVMAALRTLGCKIALDDFGIGHSGLAYLGKLPVDYLKIDKSFVSTIGTDAINRPVIDAIIDLGRKLGIGLIAEGVDKAHQCEYLRARGVHLAQGFYFSKPLVLPELIAFVSELSRERTVTSHSGPLTLGDFKE